jgi:hypothetical protein
VTWQGGESDRSRDRRWAQRRSVEIDVDVVNSEGLSFAGTVTDISEDGCMIRFASEQDLERDALHTIKLAGLPTLSGHVVWCSDGKAGLAFSEPLHSAQVQGLVTKSHYARISRNMAKKDGGEDRLKSLPRFPFKN